MLYRLIIYVAMIGLMHDARAGDLDTAYLRGSKGYEASGPPYRVEAVPPSYPTTVPEPFYLVKANASSLVYVPSRLAADVASPISRVPIAPASPAWFWTGFYVRG